MQRSVYLEALERIPRGETRSFQELAALAGRPGAARAAGRALAELPASSSLPWHRIVSGDGRLARDPEKAKAQLRRLRREGARPRRAESLAGWARRIGAPLLGYYRTRRYAAWTDPSTADWDPERVEPLSDEASALARGFAPAEGKRRERAGLPEPASPPELEREAAPPLVERLAAEHWKSATSELASSGYYLLRSLLTASECASILRESSELGRFERSVDMFPRGFGVGSYHYYREPLPEPAASLRELLYARLAPLANELWPRGGYPPGLDPFWARCRRAGQKRASSILICYGKGGVNHPHRDIYGRVWFPFQALVMLSKRGRDFTGGEFLLVEEQKEGDRLKEIAVSEGDVVVFVSRERRFAEGGRHRQIPVRHGMKIVTRGRRYGLGVVFHLAE